MSTSDVAVAALREHAARRSQHKRTAVLEALHRLKQEPSEITIAAVARTAHVSREFIHSHDELRRAVQIAAKQQLAALRPAATSDAHPGWRAERSTLLAQIERYKSLIAEQRQRLEDLERQRQRWFGEQLRQVLAVDPETHAAVHSENDRLAAENVLLGQQLAQGRRHVEQLDAELAASRRAHAEDIAALAGSANVAPLRLNGGATSDIDTRNAAVDEAPGEKMP